jgi:hypothetical protein
MPGYMTRLSPSVLDETRWIEIASTLLDSPLLVAKQREFVPIEFLLQQQVCVSADQILVAQLLQFFAPRYDRR